MIHFGYILYEKCVKIYKFINNTIEIDFFSLHNMYLKSI